MADPHLYDRLFLLDGSSLAFRAFFALPESISTQAGQPTNALFGLSQMLLKIVSEYRPSCIVCAWDAREKTFRDGLYDQYKAQRPSMPDALSAQWSLLPELMEGFGIANLVKPGYEADDILGTLAEEAKRQGIGSIVVTGDRDAMQVVDEDIWVMSTGRGVTDVKIYTPAAVLERFGVTPAQIPDYIGLKGDSSDNIPGVPGVGEKTAAQLLQQFGSIDELYRRLDEIKSEKRRALLAEHEDDARLSLQLATMVLDVPLEHDLVELVTSCGYRLPVETVDAVFERFEFANLRRRLREVSGEAAAAPAAPVSVAGGLVRLAAEPDVGPVAALLEKGEAALAFEPRGDGDGLTVAAHAGGEACLVAPADAGRAGSLWLLAGHAVVHDAKAQPGFVHAPQAPAFDTAVAAYLLAPERPEKERTLFALAGFDDGARLVEGPEAEAAAATRATLTWRVAEAQRPRLVELGLERLFREIELPLVRVLARMEAAGVKMDPYRLGEITARVRDRIDELGDTITRLAGGPFTIGSPQQLAEVLFTRLGLEPARKGKTGYSTDARVLRGLRDQHPIVPAVEEWRELTKLLNTYLEPLPARLDPVTGRLHTTFNQLVAATGRLSSSSPNLQNIPVRTDLGSEIRSCFVAEEGHKLLVADYSQIELRLMASLSAEPALLEAYHRGEDVHRVTAAAVAGIPVEEVSKRQRERAKATNFGIMYGLSAFGLSEQVEIPVEEARAFIDAYFAKYPRVREFRERVIAQATQDGYVTTLFGRRRAVPELRSSNFRNRSLGERLAVNTILQGTAADIIKVAMVKVSRELERRGLASRLVLQVHDELVLECDEGEIDACRRLLRDAMCGALDLDPALEVDIGVGDDWVAAKA
ncbi:MAG TPA: DNA polymerase I [Thermoleophilia bacterium]|nr:DNA polymerase I [Thermoleophilia bacterium]